MNQLIETLLQANVEQLTSVAMVLLMMAILYAIRNSGNAENEETKRMTLFAEPLSQLIASTQRNADQMGTLRDTVANLTLVVSAQHDKTRETNESGLSSLLSGLKDMTDVLRTIGSDTKKGNEASQNLDKHIKESEARMAEVTANIMDKLSMLEALERIEKQISELTRQLGESQSEMRKQHDDNKKTLSNIADKIGNVEAQAQALTKQIKEESKSNEIINGKDQTELASIIVELVDSDSPADAGTGVAAGSATN